MALNTIGYQISCINGIINTGAKQGYYYYYHVRPTVALKSALTGKFIMHMCYTLQCLYTVCWPSKFSEKWSWPDQPVRLLRLCNRSGPKKRLSISTHVTLTVLLEYIRNQSILQLIVLLNCNTRRNVLWM